MINRFIYKDILKEDIEDERLYGFLPMDKEVLEVYERYELALRNLYPECEDTTYVGVANDEEVADYLKIDVATLRKIRAEYDMCRIRSLNEIVTDDNGDKVALIETIVDPETDNEVGEQLDVLMDCLTKTERYVVCARHGVLGVGEQTDDEIAKKLNLSPDEVEGVYKEAILKLRK